MPGPLLSRRRTTLVSGLLWSPQRTENSCGSVPTESSVATRLPARKILTQIFKKTQPYRDRHARRPATYRSFQALHKLQLGQTARRELQTQITPDFEERLAGVKQRPDRHTTCRCPAHDFVEGLRAAI